MIYMFGIFLGVAAVLLIRNTCAHTHAVACEINNLVMLWCWSYGLIYIAFAGRKYFEAQRIKSSTQENSSQKKGIVFFLLSAACLLPFPFIQQALQGGVSPEFGKHPLYTVFTFTISALVLTAPFFPWLMLIFLKGLRHLRKQGIKGLCLSLVLPASIGGLLLIDALQQLVRNLD